MSNPIGVPLCDIQPNDRTLEAEIHDAAQRVLSSGQVILGPEVEALEEEVARYCTAGFGVGCSSGTDALLLALTALEIGSGDEVIVPTFTFFATVGSICRTGAKPVLVDIDPQTYNMNPDDLEKKHHQPELGRSCRCICLDKLRTWNRSGESPKKTACQLLKTPLRRWAQSIRTNVPVHSGRLRVTVFIRARTLERVETPAWF